MPGRLTGGGKMVIADIVDIRMQRVHAHTAGHLRPDIVIGLTIQSLHQNQAGNRLAEGAHQRILVFQVIIGGGEGQAVASGLQGLLHAGQDTHKIRVPVFVLGDAEHAAHTDILRSRGLRPGLGGAGQAVACLRHSLPDPLAGLFLHLIGLVIVKNSRYRGNGNICQSGHFPNGGHALTPILIFT